ncbi:GerAB/ArcD/ProY family transporter [Tepidibacter aestuarii]|uniref:GerAB/ArcD/ProY family transporter n=1 Tax=Tepidibacter aestuarii TaxID=2925782 RepID=UPI0020C02288|nr:endospore germination permease [Tepidibacter aestuarii]CAH2215321.1 spore germination protein KB [Tepidibacter aestuarii]
MNKETFSNIQGISSIVLFMSGTSSIVTLALEAKQDIWLATILSLSMAIIIAFILIRLHSIFQEKNLFDMLEICFGKFIGKGIILLYIWFIFHEGAQVLMNTSQFITFTSFSKTPEIISRILFLFVCTWAAKEGIEVICRLSNFLLFIFIASVLIVVLLLIPKMDINNLEPVLNNGVKPIMQGAFASFSFPFGEIVILTMFFSNFKTKESPFRIYILGLLVSGIIVLTLSLATVLTLGPDEASNTFFPTYITVARINIAFIQRTEIISALIFVLGGFIKLSIILVAICKGIIRVFNFTNYPFLVTPISILMINLSFFLHGSRMDLIKWNEEIFPYYALPFEVIFPILLFAIAEIQKRKLTNKSS